MTITTLDATQASRALSGRVYARTQGLVDITPDCARYRMIRARVGSRVVELYSDAGELLGTLAETAHGWLPTLPGGEPLGAAECFGAAVGVLASDYR